MSGDRHTIGTVASQTRASFADIVNDEGGGLGPTPLKLRGGGCPRDTAEGSMST
jgi:hypothetical protein